ncbi:MAG: nucleoside deaminase [Bacteroidales bacterium]|nr:nucleoside deaminase [Bacteroidales bacterium]
MLDHNYYMKEAIKEAHKAFLKDEVPIGAIITFDGKIIARAHNLTETLNDVTAHAEMQVITAAANALGGKYLKGCTLYVTVEPCPMCAAALYWAQINQVIYGTTDLKMGSISKGYQLFHPKTTVSGGILAKECAELMTNFFKQKRS